MSEPFDSLALYDALPPEERAAVDRALRENPALAEAFRRWQSLRAAVRRDLARALPDRALLVLYALSDEPLPGEPAPADSPLDSLLDAGEAARLGSGLGTLHAALAKHPGLVAAVRRIRADRAAFEQAWAAHTPSNGTPSNGTASNGTAPVERTRAVDRPAAPALRPVRRRSGVWRVAAVVAVVAFGSLLTYLVRRDAGFETIRTAEAQTVRLPDGSTVELAAHTTLLVPEADRARSGDGRRARLLAGQALFAVRHDAARPFTVETPNATVTVLGTTFGVDVGETTTDVVLVDGAVALASRGADEAAVRLAPGQRSRVLALDAPSAPAPADLDAALEWTGDLFLRDEPMARAAERLAAAFGVPVEVDPDLADQPVSATRFALEDGIEDALAQLALALGAEVRPLPEGGYHLAPR